MNTKEPGSSKENGKIFAKSTRNNYFVQNNSHPEYLSEYIT